MSVCPDILDSGLFRTHDILYDSFLHDPDTVLINDEGMTELVYRPAIKIFRSDPQEGASYPLFAVELNIVSYGERVERSG